MLIHKIKKVTGRMAAVTVACSFAGALLAGALMPAISAADALNPLTDRSLLLSSSSPGWDYLDGSGDALYADPGTGANGQKTGETFTFNTSTDTSSSPTIKAFTFQYCTTPAGDCFGPGDDLSDPGGSDDATHSDLNVHLSSPVEGTDFEVYVNGVASSGWVETAKNLEDTATTGKDNLITLTNTTGINPPADTPFKVVFFASASNYITNPGQGAYFVKINDYSSANNQNFRDNYPNDDVCDGSDAIGTGGTSDCPDNTIDGGVTVANVMNQSIEIQTKVLETMDFSVGTVDPDTLSEGTLGHSHGQCDPVLPKVPGSATADNTITLGNQSAEDSLSTTTPYDATSYWRLSSNSTNGATVYYSGSTLHDTELDAIAPMIDSPVANDSAYAHVGTEQFGLALNSDPDTMDSAFTTDLTTHSSDSPDYWHAPTLSPLSATPSYGGGAGTLADGSGPKFAFNSGANTTPVPIATENTVVVNCATGKMRYVGDIAATTPAGIYTTKINYLASPEY